MTKHLKFDALEYLKNNEYSFANGPDVDQIIEFLEFLKEIGIEKCTVGVDENEIWDSDEFVLFGPTNLQLAPILKAYCLKLGPDFR